MIYQNEHQLEDKAIPYIFVYEMPFGTQICKNKPSASLRQPNQAAKPAGFKRGLYICEFLMDRLKKPIPIPIPIPIPTPIPAV